MDDLAKTRALATLLDRAKEQEAMALATKEAALLGMVPWEAGNARYLEKVVGAKIVMPESLVRTVLDQRLPDFPVDWNLLLQLRGFSADAIGFAEANKCSRSISDSHPLTEAEISKNDMCQKALDAFAMANSFSGWFSRPSSLTSSAIRCNQTISVVRRLPFLQVSYTFLQQGLKDLAKKAAISCQGSLLEREDFLVVQL